MLPHCRPRPLGRSPHCPARFAGGVRRYCVGLFWRDWHNCVKDAGGPWDRGRQRICDCASRRYDHEHPDDGPTGPQCRTPQLELPSWHSVDPFNAGTLSSATFAQAGIPAAGESEDCVEQPNFSETAGSVSAWTWSPVALNGQPRLHSETERSVVPVWDELCRKALARAARVASCD